MSVRVAINGFGRIGRNVLRAIVEAERKDIKVVAINDLAPGRDQRASAALQLRAWPLSRRGDGQGRHHRLRHRPDQGDRDPRPGDNCRGRSSASTSRSNAPGIFTSKEKATAHLQAGAKRVLVSAPADNVDLTVVYGVNHDKLTKEHTVVSNASCTTNCLAPVAKVLHDAVGIEKGFMTTVHSYTNDQPSLDQLHKDLYRARAAALNMIPTSTGAAKAVGLVLPELAGKLDGISIRVPTPNVSVVDLKFIAKRATTKDEINGAVKRAAGQQLKDILGYTEQPNVSSDFNHDPHSSMFAHGPDQGDGRHVGRGDVVVRQRMGLLQPHDRYRGRDGQADLITAESARIAHRGWRASGRLRGHASTSRARPIACSAPSTTPT